MLFILLLILLSFPLSAAELFSLATVHADHRVRLKYIKVTQAESQLLSAKLDKRSEQEIKKHEAAVADAATDMLFMLTGLSENQVRLEDIDFCLKLKPNVNKIDDDDCTPLVYAIEKNITLVRELIRAGADVNHLAETGFWGKDTTLVHIANEYSKYPAMTILLEAGAPLPFDDDPKNCAWFWASDSDMLETLTAHRQHLIETIDETRLIAAKPLIPIIVNYAFGRAPSSTKTDPEDGCAVYFDDEDEKEKEE